MVNSIFEQVRIVLLNTTHPGNIGASARAMKTMGLKHLYLVNPYRHPSPEAEARATHATDILANAKICRNLQEAIGDCVAVFGASSRRRSVALPTFTAREAAVEIKHNITDKPIAILFGRESDGLSNEEMDACQYLLTIPSNPEYSALNLAAAVQVITYELHVAAVSDQLPDPAHEIIGANAQELSGLWKHLEQTLIDIDFLNPKNPGYVMRRLQRIFLRGGLSSREVKILRGVLTAAQRK